jgi:prepilin-type N-terminal cleavage/methylation domain-containing protein
MKDSEEGFSLIEIVMAMAILALGLLSYLGSFASNFRAASDTHEGDLVRVSLENVAETLRQAPFATLYSTYQGAPLEVPSLKGTNGGSATITTRFYVNELSIPAAFGPLTDIDGVPSSQSTDCSLTYKIIPAELVLSYNSTNGPTTRSLFVVIGRR